jgi:hypothetical protein
MMVRAKPKRPQKMNPREQVRDTLAAFPGYRDMPWHVPILFF